MRLDHLKYRGAAAERDSRVELANAVVAVVAELVGGTRPDGSIGGEGPLKSGDALSTEPHVEGVFSTRLPMELSGPVPISCYHVGGDAVTIRCIRMQYLLHCQEG